MSYNRLALICGLLLVGLVALAQARTRHCYQCRSRGPRGDCKDPFVYNITTVEKLKAVKVTPCASQWCAKIIEGQDDDFDIATERTCLLRPPEDQVERCAETLFQRKKVFMCFCKGDLCNASTVQRVSAILTTLSLIGLGVTFRLLSP